MKRHADHITLDHLIKLQNENNELKSRNKNVDESFHVLSSEIAYHRKRAEKALEALNVIKQKSNEQHIREIAFHAWRRNNE